MKKFLFSIAVALALMCTQIAPAMADNMKVGVIDLQQLLQNLPQMKSIGDDLKKQFGDRQKKIMDAQAGFKKDAEDFKKNSAVMSDKDKQAATQKLIAQEQNLGQMQSSFQHDYMDAQNKAVNGLLEQIKGIVTKIAARDKYDLILVNASVAYSQPSMDVTQAVLAEMKK